VKRPWLAFVLLAAAFVVPGLAVHRYLPTAFALKLHPAPRVMPEVRFQDGAGRPLSLADFRGRVVLLNVWATWCPPCREEMPSLDRLQAKLGGPDFEVVTLSIDVNGVPAVRRFYREVGIKTLKIYIDPTTDAAGRLGFPGIPGTLLIDRDGRELGRTVGPAEWDGPEAIALIQRVIGRAAESSASALPNGASRHD